MALYKFVTDIEKAIMYFNEGKEDNGHKKLRDAKRIYDCLPENDKNLIDGILGNAKKEVIGDKEAMHNHPMLEELVQRLLNMN